MGFDAGDGIAVVVRAEAVDDELRARLATLPLGSVAVLGWRGGPRLDGHASVPFDALGAWLSERSPPPAAEPRSARPVGVLLRDIARFRGWGADGARRADQLEEEVRRHYPDEAHRIAEARATGEAVLTALRELKSAASRHGPDARASRELAAQMLARWPHLQGKIERTLDLARAARLRSAESAARRAAGRPASTVVPHGDHRLLALAPAPWWTLVIDETGSRLEHGGRQPEMRFVGVVVPQGCELPSLSDATAKSMTAAWADEVLNRLLESPCGIIGVSLPDLVQREWESGVVEVIEWVTRLLPLAGPTRLDVRIEQRSEHMAGDRWAGVEHMVRRGMALRDPERADLLSLHIQVVGKSDPLVGYADVVAYTWGGSSVEDRARLAQSELEPCLMPGDGPTLRRAWDAMGAGRMPDAELWRWLVAQQGVADDRTVVGHVSESVLRRTRASLPQWEGYLRATLAHLDGRAVDLVRLGAETTWLERARPGHVPLPPALELAWQLARLAERDHLGWTGSLEHDRTLDTLSERLLEEDARLVCLVDLYRAVVDTNELAFERAPARIVRWERLPPVAVGHQLWGRILSTRGQHAAFLGRPEEADRWFAEALERFDRLGDPNLARGEARQTATYRAIAAMDDPARSDADLRQLVERVCGPLDEAVPRLAVSAEAGDKYAHHLLVRLLASRRGFARERARYLRARNGWTSGLGHPWPVIDAWRAVLLRPLAPAKALARLLAAAEAAEARPHGPTLRLMGACLRTVAHGWGQPWARADVVLDALARALPAAAARVELLRSALQTPRVPAERLLCEVLPFNFR